MKTIFKSVLTLGLVAGLGFAANAQKATSAPASATILADLTIALETNSDIAFGNVSATTPGAIVLDANGAANNSNTGSITDVARFNLAGADVAVTVQYDAAVTLTDDDSPATMVMTPEVVGAALTTAQAGAGAVVNNTQVTLASGIYYLWVGGTIPALSGQATGLYTGTLNINVEYN